MEEINFKLNEKDANLIIGAIQDQAASLIGKMQQQYVQQTQQEENGSEEEEIILEDDNGN